MTDPPNSVTHDQILDELGRAIELFEPLPEALSDTVADAAFRLHRADDVIAELIAEFLGGD